MLNRLLYIAGDSLFFIVSLVDVCRQSKVTNLELHVVVDEEVAQFQVSMDNSLTVYMFTSCNINVG